jgi:hypothetical protein
MAVAAASFWNRLSAFVYRHGEPVYHFQGLRAWEKFNPTWGPRLVYPGGMKLPRIWQAIPRWSPAGAQNLGSGLAMMAGLTPRGSDLRRGRLMQRNYCQ